MGLRWSSRGFAVETTRWCSDDGAVVATGVGGSTNCGFVRPVAGRAVVDRGGAEVVDVDDGVVDDTGATVALVEAAVAVTAAVAVAVAVAVVEGRFSSAARSVSARIMVLFRSRAVYVLRFSIRVLLKSWL